MEQAQPPVITVDALFQPGAVNFNRIAEAVSIIKPLGEEKGRIHSGAREKILYSIKSGDLGDLRGADSLMRVLSVEEEADTTGIVKAVNEALSTTLNVRIGILQNITSLYGENEADIKKVARGDLELGGLTSDALSEEVLRNIFDYRFALVPLREKGVVEITSLGDLIDALTLSKQKYDLKKAGCLDLLPTNYGNLDFSLRDEINNLLNDLVSNIQANPDQEQKACIALIISLLSHDRISYDFDPKEGKRGISLHNIDQITEEHIIYTPEELRMLKKAALLLGVKAKRYNTKIQQFEEVITV
jgi:hypothetical protein